MLKIFRFLATTVTGLAMAGSAYASTITTLPLWDGSTSINAWGGAATNTYGEVLVAPGSSLNSFTFEVNDNGQPANYVAQVYTWSGSTTSGGPVGGALYTGPASTLAGVNGFQAVTINTGGVAVTPGQTYDISLYDNSSDGVSGQWGLIAPFFSHPGVPGDVGFAFNNGPSNANGTFSDFGSLAYSATFNSVGAVPEPSTSAMMLLGFAGLSFAGFRRKQIESVAA